MNGVNFNTVNTGIHESLRGLCESVDLVVDLLNGHGTGLDFVVPAVRSCGSGSGDVVKVGNGACDLTEQGVLEQGDHGLGDSHGTTHAGCELNKQLGTGLVELLHVNGKVLEQLVVLIQPLTAGDAQRIADALHTGQDQAHAVLRAVEQEVCGLLIEVVRLHPAEQRGAAHGTLDDAVGYFYVTDLPRCKQGIVLGIHSFLPSFFCHLLIDGTAHKRRKPS